MKSSRTAATWAGGGFDLAAAAGVTATKEPRRSASQRSFSTRPRSAIRETWWDRRLFSQSDGSPSS